MNGLWMPVNARRVAHSINVRQVQPDFLQAFKADFEEKHCQQFCRRGNLTPVEMELR